MAFDTLGGSIPVIVVSLIIGLTAVIGNGIILYIALRFKKFRSSICNCLMGLLAFNELCEGVGVLCANSHTIYYGLTEVKSFNRLTCIGVSLSGIFGVISGQVTMLSMAFDRFFAVRKPLHYYQATSKNRFYISMIASLSCGSFYVWFATYNLDNTPTETCSIGASVTQAFLIAYAMFSIIISVSIFAIYIITVILLIRKSKSGDRNVALSLHRQRKVFASISLILLSYVIFWFLPMFLGLIVIATSSNPILLGYTSLTIGIFSGINSCIGIFIYLIKHQELKEYFLKIFPIFKVLKHNKSIQIVTPMNVSFANNSIKF